MMQFIKNKVPWYLKIFIKILLHKIPNKERLLRFFMFKWGDMDIPSKAYEICINFHKYSKGYVDLKGKTILELGPGDSLNSAIFYYFIGAEKIYLLDAGNYASTNMQVYYNFIDYLCIHGNEYFVNDILFLKECLSIEDLLTKINAVYMTEGLKSFNAIRSNSIDCIFSNAVLEHILKTEFESELKELYRISCGISIHIIDYKDHLSQSIYSLKFSEEVWESKLFRNAGFYTNRYRHDQVCSIFVNMGFVILNVSTEGYDKTKNIDKIKINKQFAEEKSLDIAVSRIVLKKAEKVCDPNI